MAKKINVKPPVKKRTAGDMFNEYNDSILGNIVKVADPTGISSYPDVWKAWTDGNFDYKDIVEPLGALPIVGKVGKVVKGIDKAIDITKATTKSISATKKLDKANKATKFVDMANIPFLDKAVGDFTGKAVSKIINPKSVRSVAKNNNMGARANITNRAADIFGLAETSMGKVKQKFAYGSYVEDPNSALYENQIAMSKAMVAAQNNPLVKGLNLAGGLAQQVGGAIMSSADAGTTTLGGKTAATKGVGGFLNKHADKVGQGGDFLSMLSQMFAMGGRVGGVPSEVEGEEVAHLPTGEIVDFKGPSHEQGGIDINLPEGTEMYSKRIKVDGVSMADRKKKREKVTMKLEDLLKRGRGTDALVNNSLKRTRQVNAAEEAADTKIQDIVKQTLEAPQTQEEFAWGSTVGDPPGKQFDFANSPLWAAMTGGGYQLKSQPAVMVKDGMPMYGQSSNPIANPIPTNSEVGSQGTIEEIIFKKPKPTINGIPPAYTGAPPPAYVAPVAPAKVPGEKGTGFDFESLLGGFSTGDVLGMAGNAYSAFAPGMNTEEARATDTPNVNAFAEYGKDSLDSIDSMKGYVNQVRDEGLGDAQLARNASVARNRNSARGVNTMRALDLASDAQYNETEQNIYNSSAQQMMNILGQEAQFEANQDQVVMGGEQAKDLADRQDKDNYYSNKAEDIASKGEGIQQMGKDLNASKLTEYNNNLIASMSPNGIMIGKNGKVQYTPEKLREMQMDKEGSALKAEAKEMMSGKTSGVDSTRANALIEALKIQLPDLDLSTLKLDLPKSTPTAKKKVTAKRRKK